MFSYIYVIYYWGLTPSRREKNTIIEKKEKKCEKERDFRRYID
jgi:hypothetical protein